MRMDIVTHWLVSFYKKTFQSALKRCFEGKMKLNLHLPIYKYDIHKITTLYI